MANPPSDRQISIAQPTKLVFLCSKDSWTPLIAFSDLSSMDSGPFFALWIGRRSCFLATQMFSALYRCSKPSRKLKALDSSFNHPPISPNGSSKFIRIVQGILHHGSKSQIHYPAQQGAETSKTWLPSLQGAQTIKPYWPKNPTFRKVSSLQIPSELPVPTCSNYRCVFRRFPARSWSPPPELNCDISTPHFTRIQGLCFSPFKHLETILNYFYLFLPHSEEEPPGSNRTLTSRSQPQIGDPETFPPSFSDFTDPIVGPT